MHVSCKSVPDLHLEEAVMTLRLSGTNLSMCLTLLMVLSGFVAGPARLLGGRDFVGGCDSRAMAQSAPTRRRILPRWLSWPVVLAAPVVVGTMDWAAARARLRSRWGRS